MRITMTRGATAGFVIVTSALIAACSPESPSTVFASTPGIPPTVYSGSIVDAVGGSGTITVSLVNIDGLVSGTWNASYGGQAARTLYISGNLSGTAYSARNLLRRDEPALSRRFRNDQRHALNHMRSTASRTFGASDAIVTSCAR